MSEDQAEFKVNDRRMVETSGVIPEESSTTMVMMAMQKGYTPEIIEKMMDLAERNEKNEARKAYHRAMAQFKSNPPEIEKDKKVSFQAGGKEVGYSHASLGNVAHKINKALSDCDLSASWTTKQDNGAITVTCRITHAQGHSEETSLTAAPDLSGSKNAIQAMGSTISYLERYTVLALTGLATADMDDDGVKSETVEYITPKEAADIIQLMTATGTETGKFLEYLKEEAIDSIPASKLKMAMTALSAKKKAMEKKKAEKPEREPGEDG